MTKVIILQNLKIQNCIKIHYAIFNNGGFHLQLLVFPLVYQFNSRIRVLGQYHLQMTSSDFRRISTTLQDYFKICLLWFLHKKECSVCTPLFWCTEMRWLFISSIAIWVTDSDTGSVASKARSQLTKPKWEWTRIWTI